MAQTDHEVLLVLYRWRSGPKFKATEGCDTGFDLSKMQGVEVNDQGRVVKLFLGFNRLRGTIPGEFGKLTALRLLDLGANGITGPIPPEFGELAALTSLVLEDNQLTGSIPKELGGLTQLTQLSLFHNQLAGSIPAELGNLAALTNLVLYGNQLSGPIPPEFGKLAALRCLELENNQLTGSIPKELGGLTQLKQLSLFQNQLAGSIPAELGNLAALTKLVLNNNQLSGMMPKELGKLTALTELFLHCNNLSGTIPKELGRLTALTKLSLGSNTLSGHVPKELGDAGKLGTVGLVLESNYLTGFGATEDALQLVKKVGPKMKLANNPWITPPEAVVEAGHVAMEMYFVDVQEAEKAGLCVAMLQLLKVVFVGSASAGKTSLMNSIVAGSGCPTKGTPEEASTVGVELIHYQLGDTKIEFFDCAGQVNYAGMHQTFLTRRALYMLVVDITKYQDPNTLDEVIHDDIMRWLYYLYLRAPGSTVILVANKCDGSIDDFVETANRVEGRVRELLEIWHDARGLRGQSKGLITDVNILRGMSCVSCEAKGLPEASGLPALKELIAKQAANSIVVPPAWDLALEVIGALRAGCDPVPAARKKLRVSDIPQAQKLGNSNAFAFISKEDLSRKWKGVVENVSPEVPAATVANWESALDGALWISDFAGHTLRIDGGEGVFLDAPWLSEILNPILSHKMGSQFFEHKWLSMRRQLVDDNVLRREFALYLWSESIGHVAVQSAKVTGALFLTLIKLGVALPLGRGAHGDGSDVEEMLVVMKLDEKCTIDKRRRFEELAAHKLPGDREVVLKWKFDKAGPPQGLVERLITSCHVLGKVEYDACWRYGAVFTSHFKRGRVEPNARLYTVTVSMTSYTDPDRELTARVVGPLKDERVWAAVRFVASAMVIFSKEWPGVLWEGWPACGEHHREKVYLSPTARIGDLLLPAADPDAERRDWCECLLHSIGVLPLVREKLGNVIDVGKDPFEGLEISDADDVTQDSSTCKCVSEVFERWRPHAWRTAQWLFGLAVVLLTTAVVTGIVEDNISLWASALAVVCMLLAFAVVASVFACRSMLRDEEPAGQDEPPVDEGPATFA